MNGLFATAYFGPISMYQKLTSCSQTWIEVHEHMVKQSYRNRCVILSANGKMNLTVPLDGRRNHKPIQDQKILSKEHWVAKHLKSMDAAYRSSAYYEFYQPEIAEILNRDFTYLLDLNNAVHEFVMDSVQLETTWEETQVFQSDFDGADFRSLIHPKKESLIEAIEYPQVFDEKYGFQKDLSILDLLFNQGPNSYSFIEV